MLLRKCIICHVVYGCLTSEKRSVCQQCSDDHDCKSRKCLLLLGDDYVTAGICFNCKGAVRGTSHRPSHGSNEVIHS
ncbi:MAG: hypothetical protein SWH78_10950 [Thermodesulfobacteriota bacterium]|nr:hypothetical protein [Thermodesulfobacteriota bacterium]